MGGMEGGETVVRMYRMREESIFNKIKMGNLEPLSYTRHLCPAFQRLQ